MRFDQPTQRRAPTALLKMSDQPTVELGFEAEFPRLVSRCSGVGNHCFSSDFYKNRTDPYCIGVEPTLPIFLPNSYQESREAWRFFLASRAISKKNLLASLAILCWP